MKTKHLLLFILAGFAFAACTDPVEKEIDKEFEKDEKEILAYINSINANFTRTTTGLYYQKTKTNATGASAKVGEQARISYKFTLLNGNFVDSSTTGKPVGVLYADGWIFAGLYEAISLLKEGEKGVFLIPSLFAFRDTKYENVPEWSVIRAEVEVIDFRDEEEQINDYILTKGYTNVEKTGTNLRFIKQTSTEGVGIVSGDKVDVKYTGKFLNDNTFDNGTFALTTGTNSVIKGFEEAVLKLKVGEKAIAIFPSAIGYVNGTSSGTIPPYTPLVFELEITKKY